MMKDHDEGWHWGSCAEGWQCAIRMRPTQGRRPLPSSTATVVPLTTYVIPGQAPGSTATVVPLTTYVIPGQALAQGRIERRGLPSSTATVVPLTTYVIPGQAGARTGED